MGVPERRDDGCLICGRPAGQVPVGVFAEYALPGDREGERVWLCEECAQVREYARAFVMQVREHYGVRGGVGWEGVELPPDSFGYSYRIASPVLRAQVGEDGLPRFHAWTIDL